MILLLIDVQDQFGAAKKQSLVQACRREIKNARQLQFPIITVTYDDDEVLTRVEKALRGYNRRYHTAKYQDNGSADVISLCRQKGLDMSSFRICGVNISACVRKTALGLLSCLPEVKLDFVYDGCGCSMLNHEEAFRSLYARFRTEHLSPKQLTLHNSPKELQFPV